MSEAETLPAGTVTVEEMQRQIAQARQQGKEEGIATHLNILALQRISDTLGEYAKVVEREFGTEAASALRLKYGPDLTRIAQALGLGAQNQ